MLEFSRAHSPRSIRVVSLGDAWQLEAAWLPSAHCRGWVTPHWCAGVEQALLAMADIYREGLAGFEQAPEKTVENLCVPRRALLCGAPAPAPHLRACACLAAMTRNWARGGAGKLRRMRAPATVCSG